MTIQEIALIINDKNEYISLDIINPLLYVINRLKNSVRNNYNDLAHVISFWTEFSFRIKHTNLIIDLDTNTVRPQIVIRSYKTKDIKDLKIFIKLDGSTEYIELSEFLTLLKTMHTFSIHNESKSITLEQGKYQEICFEYTLEGSEYKFNRLMITDNYKI